MRVTVVKANNTIIDRDFIFGGNRGKNVMKKRRRSRLKLKSIIHLNILNDKALSQF